MYLDGLEKAETQTRVILAHVRGRLAKHLPASEGERGEPLLHGWPDAVHGAHAASRGTLGLRRAIPVREHQVLRGGGLRRAEQVVQAHVGAGLHAGRAAAGEQQDGLGAVGAEVFGEGVDEEDSNVEDVLGQCGAGQGLELEEQAAEDEDYAGSGLVRWDACLAGHDGIRSGEGQ